jgi:hypothetical protein
LAAERDEHRSWVQSLASPAGLTLLFLLSLPLVTPRLNASDEIQFFAWLRSAAFDQDADFENEYRHFYEHGPVRDALFHETFLERTNENGRRLNFTPVGTAILWAPFYGVGHLVAALSGAPRDGYSAPYVYAVTYASALYGWLAVLLSAAIVTRVLGGGRPAALAVWFGTPLLFYMYLAPGFAHACSAFAVALFLWLWLRARESWSVAGTVPLGLAAALVAMVREQDLLLLAGPALDFLAWLLRPRVWSGASAVDPQRLRRAALAGLAGVGAATLAYLPQLWAYLALNGHPGPTTYVTRKMTWTSPHLAGVLFSPEHGLFVWTPLSFMAVLGLCWLAAGGLRSVSPGSRPASPDTRWLGLLALVMFGLQAYVSGSVESWTVAGSFGQRRFVALTPILTLGLAALAPGSRPKGRRIFRVTVAGLCIWWNLGLMAQFGLHLMDRQRLQPLENARVTFVELPRQAPAIAWRYLTDRQSLYRLPRR